MASLVSDDFAVRAGPGLPPLRGMARNMSCASAMGGRFSSPVPPLAPPPILSVLLFRDVQKVARSCGLDAATHKALVDLLSLAPADTVRSYAVKLTALASVPVPKHRVSRRRESHAIGYGYMSGNVSPAQPSLGFAGGTYLDAGAPGGHEMTTTAAVPGVAVDRASRVASSSSQPSRRGSDTTFASPETLLHTRSSTFSISQVTSLHPSDAPSIASQLMTSQQMLLDLSFVPPAAIKPDGGWLGSMTNSQHETSRRASVDGFNLSEYRVSVRSRSPHPQTVADGAPDGEARAATSADGGGGPRSRNGLLDAHWRGLAITDPEHLPSGTESNEASPAATPTASLNRVAAPPVEFDFNLRLGTDEAGFEFINDYLVQDVIGQGSQGQVLAVTDVRTGEARAMKVMRRDRFAGRFHPLSRNASVNSGLVADPASFSMSGDGTSMPPQAAGSEPADAPPQVVRKGSLRREIHKEVAIMKKLNHRNVTRLHEVIDDPKEKRIYLIMDLANGGPIAADLNPDSGACTPVPPAVLAPYVTQIVSGLDYLHRHHVFHRDVKPDNILLHTDADTGETVVKIVDFGVAEMNETGKVTSGSVGTPSFLSPELHLPRNTVPVDGGAADVWALGATVFNLLFGAPPFAPSRNEETIGEAVINHPLEFPSPLPEGSEVFLDFLRGTLTKDPESRWTLRAVRRWLSRSLLRTGRTRRGDRNRRVAAALGCAVAASAVAKAHDDPSWLGGPSSLVRAASCVASSSARAVLVDESLTPRRRDPAVVPAAAAAAATTGGLPPLVSPAIAALRRRAPPPSAMDLVEFARDFGDMASPLQRTSPIVDVIEVVDVASPFARPQFSDSRGNSEADSGAEGELRSPTDATTAPSEDSMMSSTFGSVHLDDSFAQSMRMDMSFCVSAQDLNAAISQVVLPRGLGPQPPQPPGTTFVPPPALQSTRRQSPA